jgi:ketosteroid isomerase-like protein
MQPQDLAALAQAAFNARDEAALRALWTDDFHFRGPDGESRSADAMLAREHNLWRVFPDVKASVRTVAVGPDVAVLETTMNGTHAGPLGLGDRELAPTGKALTLVFSVHIWFRDGRACGERVFYDRLAMFQQLGLAA